ncbi:FtsH protease activity modulator HflK [Acidovorax sp.]|jgi:membrane protease subunit HflK|uniref:FtsH protease activity modulator HflK n=1 Tax=Acidovorax sp. TaxID=1872122 RepID=UPI00391EF003
MNFLYRIPLLASLPARLTGMFNLNDPRWGRGDDKSEDDTRPDSRPAGPANGQRGSEQRPSNGGQPPDLDELWRDLNRKLGGVFGSKGGGANGRNGAGGSGPGGGFQPDMKSASVGVGLIAGVAFLIWMGTGFFIVQEGQQAVITQFGKYKSTVGAGFNWRLPYPIERHELVFVTQIRSADVGRDTVIKSTGLRESAMLTEDENIVEIKFAVQYRLNDARAWLFESKNPSAAVVQAAETAVREVVGKMRMDTALAEERDQIGPRVRMLMQSILDQYKVGVEVVGINLQQGGVRPPEQVQSSFDDVLKAGQERERAKNEAQAYANDVIPRAVGSAARLNEEASAYKARIVAQAQGDAQRFSSILAEYQKAPQVTRDRMYLEAMQQIYGNVTKVLVESRQGSNLLYLPLDKIIQGATSGSVGGGDLAGLSAAGSGAVSPAPSAPMVSTDPRARDSSRTRDRESR